MLGVASLAWIDIETCRSCGGKLRVIASIEEPAVIERILAHLGCITESADPANPGRAPEHALPEARILDRPRMPFAGQ